VAQPDPASGCADPLVQNLWIRAVDKLPDDAALHHCLLAYVSDFYLLSTVTLHHPKQFETGRRFFASIDHAMWFHRPLRVDDWFLNSSFSPSASGSRGFARGSVYTRDGVLAASTAQEGLVRLVDPPAP
jgi:acyl-CoA thioesterase-2